MVQVTHVSAVNLLMVAERTGLEPATCRMLPDGVNPTDTLLVRNKLLRR